MIHYKTTPTFEFIPYYDQLIFTDTKTTSFSEVSKYVGEALSMPIHGYSNVQARIGIDVIDAIWSPYNKEMRIPKIQHRIIWHESPLLPDGDELKGIKYKYLIAGSKYAKENIEHYYKVDDILPRCIPASMLEYRNKKVEKKYDYTIVTTADIRKGVEEMIDIIRIADKELSEKRKIFFFAPWMFIDELSKLELKNIDLTIVESGSLNREEKIKTFLESKAIIYPTKAEGFGLVALESWALGIPIITTRARAVDDWCPDSVCYKVPIIGEHTVIHGGKRMKLFVPDFYKIKDLIVDGFIPNRPEEPYSDFICENLAFKLMSYLL